MIEPALYVSFGATSSAPSVSPPGVSGIVSVVADTPTSAIVKWNAVADATGYRLERAADNGAFSIVATLGATTTYADSGLTTGSTYRYRITASGPGGYGASSPVAAVTPAVATSLATPTDFAAAASTPGKIALTWGGTTTSVAVVIQRSIDGGLSWSNLVTLPGNLHTYADSVSRATLYDYRISAKSYTAVSAISGSVALLTSPPDVSAIERTAVTTNTATFSWNASIGATGYLLEGSADGVTFDKTTSVAGGVVSATLTGLSTGTKYTVRITALNAGGDSNAIKLVGVLTLPSVPQQLTATVEDGPVVALSFLPVVGASSYFIERRSPGRPWGNLVTIKSPATAYTDVQVDSDEDYEYRVTAVNDSGSSDPSESVIASTDSGDSDISAPTNLASSAGAKGVLNLAWTTVGKPDGFTVQRLYGTAWKNVATVASTVTTVPIKGIAAGASATLRVVALRNGTMSTPSDTLTLTALPTQIKAIKTLGTVSSDSVTLTWAAPAGSTLYKLERSTDRVNWTTLTDTLNQAAYVDNPLDPGTTYAYRVTAGNSSGFGLASSTLVLLTPPDSPDGVMSVASGKTIQLTWTDVSGETGYKIQGSIDGSKWSQVAVAKANITSATVKPGKNTLFRVASYNKTGSSDFSSPASVSSQGTFSIEPMPDLIPDLSDELWKPKELY